MILESTIQTRVVSYAREHGAVAIKLNTMGAMGTAGWPDYLFCYDGRALFIEFKQPGKDLTSLQRGRHTQLDKVGFSPFMIDDIVAGKKLLDRVFGW